MEWEGLPPPGCTDEFIIFNDRLSFFQKILLMFLQPFDFVPFFQVLSSYKLRLKNLKFGGIDPEFVPMFNCVVMLKHYIKTICYCCSLCAAKEKKFVDSCTAPLATGHVEPVLTAPGQQTMAMSDMLDEGGMAGMSG